MCVAEYWASCSPCPRLRLLSKQTVTVELSVFCIGFITYLIERGEPSSHLYLTQSYLPPQLTVIQTSLEPITVAFPPSDYFTVAHSTQAASKLSLLCCQTNLGEHCWHVSTLKWWVEWLEWSVKETFKILFVFFRVKDDVFKPVIIPKSK